MEKNTKITAEAKSLIDAIGDTIPMDDDFRERYCGEVTPEMVMNYEAEALVEAIGDAIPVDDGFLDRYCGERIKKALEQIKDVQERCWVLSDHLKISYFNGTIPDLADDEILLPCEEIEYPFGDEEELDNSSGDFTINGDCAYLYVGYGLTIKVDCDGLEKAVAEYLEEQK